MDPRRRATRKVRGRKIRTCARVRLHDSRHDVARSRGHEKKKIQIFFGRVCCAQGYQMFFFLDGRFFSTKFCVSLQGQHSSFRFVKKNRARTKVFPLLFAKYFQCLFNGTTRREVQRLRFDNHSQRHASCLKQSTFFIRACQRILPSRLRNLATAAVRDRACVHTRTRCERAIVRIARGQVLSTLVNLTTVAES